MRILVYFFILYYTQITAQNTSKWAVVAQIFHQDDAISFDFGSLSATDEVLLRPGVAAGLERTWAQRKSGRIRFYQDVHLGFWHSPYNENYYYAGTRLGLDIRILRQLRLSPGLLYRVGGVKARDVRYVYEDGKWEKARNSTPVFLRHTVAPDLQLGWRFWANTAHPMDIQVGGNIQLIGKHLPVDFQPNFFLLRSVRIGVRYGL